MLIQPTLDTLNRLKLHGMALALSEQMTTQRRPGSCLRGTPRVATGARRLHRENSRMTRLLQLAQLKYREAVIEDLDYRSRSGLDRSQSQASPPATGSVANQKYLDPWRHRQRQDLPRLCARASSLPQGLERVVRPRAAPVRGVQPLPCRWQLPQAPRRDRQDQRAHHRRFCHRSHRTARAQ